MYLYLTNPPRPFTAHCHVVTTQRLLLQHRPCATEKECLTWRYWNGTVADEFATALARRFRTYKVHQMFHIALSFEVALLEKNGRLCANVVLFDAFDRCK